MLRFGSKFRRIFDLLRLHPTYSGLGLTLLKNRGREKSFIVMKKKGELSYAPYSLLLIFHCYSAMFDFVMEDVGPVEETHPDQQAKSATVQFAEPEVCL